MVYLLLLLLLRIWHERLKRVLVWMMALLIECYCRA